MSIFLKIITAAKERPTYLLQYARGAFLFGIARPLGLIFLNRQRLILGKNVRFQSVRCFLTASQQSRISVGSDSIIYENARLEVYDQGHINIGESSILGDVRIVSREKITLGKRLLTSWNVLLQDFDPHPTSQKLRALQVQKMTADFFPRFGGVKTLVPVIDWVPPRKEIWIGDDVWLGANCIILKGTRIGSGSIVAAGAVVTGGTFPDNSLIAGNPAQLVKELPR